MYQNFIENTEGGKKNRILQLLNAPIVGEKVINEHGEARRKICNVCPEKTSIMIGGLIEMDICGVCKCPISRKIAYKSHFLQAINPLSPKDEQQIEKVNCPLNKWEEIEKRFKND